MQITRHTDIALRLLMYLSVRPQRVTIGDAAEGLRVSRHHLVKIAGRLGELGHLDVVRGNAGGICLAGDPRQITVGRIFRELENCSLVECFDRDSSACVFTGNCVLEGAFRSAFEAFCEQLDKFTLSELVRDRSQLVTTLDRDRQTD